MTAGGVGNQSEHADGSVGAAADVEVERRVADGSVAAASGVG